METKQATSDKSKRLIDAKFAQHIANVELSHDDAGTVQWVLSHTPTVDAVEVVRCKNCEFYKLKDYQDGIQRYCCENRKAIWTATPPDAFCSYGERKTDG